MFQPAFIKSVENCRAHSFWQRKFMKRREEEKTFARRKSVLFLPLATSLPLPRRWYGFPLALAGYDDLCLVLANLLRMQALVHHCPLCFRQVFACH